ncbi:gamma-glutamyl-gamma-aminobutyrate hydrolase family protein [Lutimaribacter marinistellae]|uniref:Gamma-glutamyl-gamma-aminobutyrate hydrolase family protein n=1 Tax=Lutimaribacter marinistellae TaxID=1820329 RepID=A0ABV7TK74_9RHOB
MRPRIGVTVSQRSGWRIFPLIALNLWLVGGRAVRWQAAREIDLEKVDGVIIGGGDDIAPTLYGGDVKLTARIDLARDRLEKSVLEHAFSTDRPILGICRGAQMLNVVLGGTLHQDAFAHYTSRKYRTILPRRTVSVAQGSRLASLVRRQTVRVNALHSQAVDTLGQGLRISAQDEKGMVQAIERVSDPFAIGVQWHPEHLFYKSAHRNLFRALVDAARAWRVDRNQLRAVDRAFSHPA